MENLVTFMLSSDLRLALSKGPNRVGVSLPHVRTETDPVSEMLRLLVSRIPDDRPSPNGIHHLQNNKGHCTQGRTCVYECIFKVTQQSVCRSAECFVETLYRHIQYTSYFRLIFAARLTVSGAIKRMFRELLKLYMQLSASWKNAKEDTICDYRNTNPVSLERCVARL
jgi:hypothetical protein